MGLFGKEKNPGEVRSAVFFVVVVVVAVVVVVVVVAVLLLQKAKHEAHLLYVPIQAMGRPRFL